MRKLKLEQHDERKRRWHGYTHFEASLTLMHLQSPGPLTPQIP